ncbi:hypothetical protein BDM02DRAFT_3167886 [Thelephora ganbajun]|uniref:Uncharacterized protein n=1 Tax=Thelephora ganbajun TaxID=370292 RepID=A0ACB6ZI04_THEGA|nr:hypothetical protein BDM02DRAFT_3167886 [Thelephora ganbajun]
MSANATRLRVIGLYKELHRLGRDYPDPSYDYQGRMRRLFENNKHLKTEEEINQALRLGEFIKQGLEFLNRLLLTRLVDGGGTETLALYSLRKYRHLKRMYSLSYPSTPQPQPQPQKQPHTG